MGFVMRRAKTVALHASRDEWTKKAFDAGVAVAKELIGDQGPIRPGTPVGRLGDDEWGWITSSVAWAFVAIRAEQAATEGWNEERAIRATGLDPDPWFDGAVAAILPKLADACPDLDWSKPVGEWSKDEIVEFLSTAITLTRRAVAARNVAEERIAGKLETVDTLLEEICPFEEGESPHDNDKQRLDIS
jgi:hypothetical protein